MHGKKNDYIKSGDKRDYPVDKNTALKLKNKINKKTLSHVWHIGTAAILFVAVVIASCVIFYYTAKKESREIFLNELNEYAQSVNVSINSRIDSDFDTLEGISAFLSAVSADGVLSDKEIKSTLVNINGLSDIIHIGVASTDGVADMIDLNGNEYSVNLSSDETFTDAISGKNSVRIADASGVAVVRYAVPVVSDGAVTAVLIADSTCDILLRIIDIDKNDGHDCTFIINSLGEQVILPDSQYDGCARYVADNERDMDLFKSAIENNGSFDYVSRDGTNMTAVIIPLDINDWHIFYSLSEDYISSPYKNSVSVLFLIIIPALCMFLFLLSLSIRLIDRTRKRLYEQSEENKTVIKQSGKYVMRYDLSKHMLYVLSDLPEIYGDLPKIIANVPNGDIISEAVLADSINAYRGFFGDMESGIDTGSINLHIKVKDGSVRWLHADYTLVPSSKHNGKVLNAIISFYDNTEAYEHELAYEIRQTELASLKENSKYYIEANLMTGAIDSSHGEAINLSSFEGDATNLYELIEWDAKNNIHPDDEEKFSDFFDKSRLYALYALSIYTDSTEFRSMLDGELIWISVTVLMTKYPYTDDIKICVIFRDINDEHKQHELLHGKATRDSLSGLLNRETTMGEIEKFILGDGASGIHALFMIDIDNFKEVNDTLGHQSGDDVLSKLSKTIKRCFRSNDIIGRIGGDEFFAFMKNTDKPGVIQQKAHELNSELQTIYASNGKHINLSGSIGITVYNGDMKPRKSLKLLYAEADAALYKAKALGKNCAVYSNDNEKLEIKSESISSHRTLSINLRNLLNNLGSGIEIYHGTPDGDLFPLFCNTRFLDIIGGMSSDEFFDIYGRDAFAGVHPDDKYGFMEMFNISLRDKTPFKYTYRIRGGSDKYVWITVFANFVICPDGSFDLYAIYSDAEQAMQNREALLQKYRSFCDFHSLLSANTIAAFHLNLTTGMCEEGVCSHPLLSELTSEGKIADFIEKLLENIDSERYKNEFTALFDTDALVSMFSSGEDTHYISVPLVVPPAQVLWVRISVNLTKNPDTNDIEAAVCIFDVDKETRLQYMIDRMLKTDYEFLGQVDIKTGLLTVFGENVGGDINDDINSDTDNSGSGETDVYYEDELPIILRDMIRDEFYEECLAALKIDRITAALAESETYVISFPTKSFNGMREGFRQWRCGYIGERKRFIMISRSDVTDTMAGERDTLTGLYNASGFYNVARQHIDANPDMRFRIHRFDIDGFKVYNDTLGFSAGDQLLRDFGAVLRRRSAAIGESVIFARLDADHFVSLRPDTPPYAEELMTEINNWLASYKTDYNLSSHMGVYRTGDGVTDVSSMCDRALLALRSIKGNFSVRVAYYDDSLRDKLIDEQEFVCDMVNALRDEQFEVYFQPQYNYEDGCIVGAEALVRWNHPTRGILSPAVFIPVFERNGFITSLDEYIWERACIYMRRWLDSPDSVTSVPVSVNISRIDIYTPGLTSKLKALTEKYRIPVQMLKLEITETAYMQNPEQLIRVVKELQGEGFIIEMDDFGSGYSSLNTLKDVPVDILKLDMKFISHSENNERGGNILSSVIRMAHWLKIPVIAEGVENKAQADYLKGLGCVYMQGYYFAHPMRAEQFEAILKEAIPGQMDKYGSTDVTGAAAFWDPSAQTALIFDSYVGGAAILEYNAGNVEILRANDKFYSQLKTSREEYIHYQRHTLDRFEGIHRAAFEGMLREAMETGGEAECDVQSLQLDDNGRRFWTHNRARMLARNGDSRLFYLSTENITDRKIIEEKLRISVEALQLAIARNGCAICSYDIIKRELTLPSDYAEKHGLPDNILHIDSSLLESVSLGGNHAIGYQGDKENNLHDFFTSIHNGEPCGSVIIRINSVNKAQSGTNSVSGSYEQLDFVSVLNDASEATHAIITCREISSPN